MRAASVWVRREHRSWRQCFRAAFTLIELLVVVAIIALLIAILLPSLRSARAHARRTVCAARIYQILLGWEHFLSERNDRLPAGLNVQWTYGGQQGTASGVGFQDERPLNPSLGLERVVGRIEQTDPPPLLESNRIPDKGAEIFQCPSDAGDGSATRPGTFFSYYGTSYLANEVLIGRDLVAGAFAEPYASVFARLIPRLSRLTRSKIDVVPSRVVLMGDGGWWKTWLPATMITFESARSADWHEKPGHYTIGFLDGHAVFTSIRKGIGVCQKYSVVPFNSDAADLEAVQQEWTEP